MTEAGAMFQKRNSQKPSNDLIASFNKTFLTLPRFGHTSSEITTLPPRPASSPGRPFASEGSSGLMSFDPRNFGQFEDHEEDNTTPGGTNFGPSTSQGQGSASGSGAFYPSFMDFPTPSGWQQTPGSGQSYQQSHHHMPSMLYNWPPSFQPSLPTPSSRSLSLPSSIQQQPAYLNLQDVHIQPPYQSHNLDFSSAYQPFSPPANNLSSFKVQSDSVQQAQSSLAAQEMSSSSNQVTDSPQFRFQVTLMNGTAMVKDNEIPVSYLNKRQTYTIKIRDSKPESTSSSIPTTYRTYIRVSFHEEKQRAHPDQHWQLWKEGRGMNEAQQHGGKLQAVEYVPSPSAPGQISSIHVEKESFDGFCVTWTAPNTSPPECKVQFRCNFLSTDFSRSKGVKGIPVRLCAKNEVVAFTGRSSSQVQPEICYCKIKLFRDHGAERKLTNDESAVRRLITKTEEQTKQANAGNDEDYTTFEASSSKRKAADLSPVASRPSKMTKLKRSASFSSDNSSQGQDHLEGDLPAKIAALTRLLRSKQDLTAFFLQGESSDDPDLFPVSLLDSSEAHLLESPEIKRVQRRDTQLTDISLHSGHSLDVSAHSVSPATHSLQLPLQLPTPANSHPSSDWRPDIKLDHSTDSATSNVQHSKSSADPPSLVRGPSLRSRAGVQIQAMDVNPNYEAPPETVARPVACFYVQLRIAGVTAQDDYYRAIYLYERSASALVNAIARKQDLSPHDIVESVYIGKHDHRQLQVKLDDDMVSHMAEGQDMVVEFTARSSSPKRATTRRASEHPRYSLTLRY